jgi:hypothetical protein
MLPTICSQQEASLISPLLTSIKAIQLQDKKSLMDSIEVITSHSLDALDEFLKGNLSRFDPSIGDEACQIRTLYVLDLSKQNLTEDIEHAKTNLCALVSRIKQLRTDITCLEQTIAEAEMQTKRSRESFIERKTILNAEKMEAFNGVSHSAERKAITQAFLEKIKKIKEEEKPILQELSQKKAGILKKIEQAFANATLDASLSNRMRLLALCYILTKIKHPEIDESNPNFLMTHDKKAVVQLKIEGLTHEPKQLDAMVEQAKKILNLASVEFLQKQAGMIEGKRAPLLNAVMQKILPSSKEGFKELSFYHGMEVILKRAKDLGVPLLLKARKPKELQFSSMQLFQPIGEKNKYTAVPIQSNDGTARVMVIEGVSSQAGDEGIEAISNRVGGLSKLVKLNLAQHRLCTAQPNLNLSILKETVGLQDEEIENIKALRDRSIGEGCSIGNPSRFLIEHVYADSLNNQLRLE